VSNSQFRVIESRIKQELSNIDRLVQQLAKRGFYSSPLNSKENFADEFILRAVGSIFHDFYSAVENIFKIIARYIDESIPEGSEWHSGVICPVLRHTIPLCPK
jgi:hypothetical protein